MTLFDYLEERLPEDMRWCTQWCVAVPGQKAPHTVDAKGHVYRASNTKREQWLDFHSACTLAQQVGGHVGFILTEEDPFTCIDLDVKDKDNYPDNPEVWTTQADLDRYWRITQEVSSFTEVSRSGKGLHIWVRGKIGEGRKRQGVEIYSQERFIICTGNVLLHHPIHDRQELLTKFIDDIRELDRAEGKYSLDPLENQDDTNSDSDIVNRAMGAENAEKFAALCNATSCTGEGVNKIHGTYTALGYDSQSEADFALLSMFTFYTRSNEQVKRLFRMTGLGKRAKSQRDDRYLNMSIARIRTREKKEQSSNVDPASLVSAEVARINAQRAAEQGAGGSTTGPQGPVAAAAIATMAPKYAVPAEGLPWPPGFVGALANFIYGTAPRPVREVAIVAALGLMAGICGRTWLLQQSGLNMYIILVARSAIGKEAMHSGISILVNKLASSIPAATQFVDFADFASGPALTKAVASNPCFVNVSGEWGRKLKKLANDERGEGPMQSLRTAMTNLYQKSGPTAIVGGISYSQRDNNIASVSGVSYSMIGETTPGTYYDSLTETMMEDGFLSRFVVIEYAGQRPPANHVQNMEPDAALIDHLRSIAAYSLDLQTRASARIYVQRDQEAGQILYDFDNECDTQINSTKDESWRQMWNRAALKVTRISALLAVADNPTTPWMNKAHVEWALDVVRRDIAMMQTKMSSGDVGADDHTREKKLLSIVKEYVHNGVSPGYNVPIAMQQAGIIPRKVFQIRITRLNAFTQHRMGSTAALEVTIKSLIDNGYLMECDKNKITAAYGSMGKCYQILSFGEEHKSAEK